MLGSKIRGVVLFETILVLPILFLIVFAIIQFGSLFFNRQQIQHIAYNATRAAVMNVNSDASQIESLIDTQMTNLNLTDHTTTITDNFKLLQKGQPITVSISIPVSQLVWLNNYTLNFSNMNIKVQHTMAKEY
jgi:Flp pilus assembly protein TadG